MAEAYIVDAVRTPGRAPRRRPEPGAPGRPRRARAPRAGRAHRHRPARGRGRRLRLRRHDRPAGRRHRPHVLARRRPARRGAGHHRRPPVRLVAAGRALRRAGRDERHERPRRRRRRAEHEPDPDLVGDARRRAVRLHRPVLGLEGLGRALRRPGGHPVPVGRDDRREVGHLPRGHGGVRAREPPPRGAGHDEGRFERRSSPLGDAAGRRGPAPRARHREDEEPADACARAGASPRPSPARSPTRRRRC